MYGTNIPYMWYCSRTESALSLSYIKTRKLNTDIYGKDCKEIDGFSR